MYTAEQSAVAEAMTAIKAVWHCDEHGTCFIDGKRDHIKINRFCLKAWASAVVCKYLICLVDIKSHDCSSASPLMHCI